MNFVILFSIILVVSLVVLWKQAHKKPKNTIDFIPNDCIISCPKCENHIIKTTRAIMPGDKLTVSDFVVIDEGFALAGDTVLNCNKCDTPFSQLGKDKGIQLHTIHGWLPQ